MMGLYRVDSWLSDPASDCDRCGRVSYSDRRTIRHLDEEDARGRAFEEAREGRLVTVVSDYH